jgi:predicted DCC family thiol-disulfide oxidoreductase YuxK
MTGLTVLYDAQCSLCAFVRGWLGRQRQLVPLTLVPAGSQEARGRFPELDHAATRAEITVVGDEGQVYQGEAAWLVCLWALSEYRPLSHRLAGKAGAPFARTAVLAAAKYRERQQRPQPRPGWNYAPATGWTYVQPQACGDGCRPPG